MLGLRCMGLANTPILRKHCWGDFDEEEGGDSEDSDASTSGGGGGWGNGNVAGQSPSCSPDGFRLDGSSAQLLAAAAAAGTGPLSPEVSTLALALALVSVVESGTLRWTLSRQSLSRRSMPAGRQSP